MPADLPGKRVPAENWHLTLRFLGDTPPALRDGLVAELESTTLGEPFAVRFGGLGAFPHPRRARVLWLGVAAGAAGLRALAAATEEAAQRAGFPAADKPFSPHLTLSRIRPPRSVAALLEGAGPLDVGMEVDEVVLYRSHLGKGPARYEAVARFALP
ncbi:RNA 2',3'-cyclic phosphodiesterase [soil metagenome]